MQIDVLNEKAVTDVGSYFIANYPPFSAWTPQHVPLARNALDRSSASAQSGLTITPSTVPLGLYLHIPFCRKRCKFCYFRVYTDRNSDDVEEYMNGLAMEAEIYAGQPALADREFEFVYFGGGTPSFLSSEQLLRLIERIREHWDWDHAREVTFECEPGTLKKAKLETIKAIGTTRLSLGIEHFDDEVLSIGGRAHKSPEVFRAYEWAREIGFDQINIDLIAGMVGDSDSKWKETVEKALALQPDSLTIYQMEVPHNTVIAREAQGSDGSTHVPNWATKRAWVAYAFDLFERAGYDVSSGYTLVKRQSTSNAGQSGAFVYRDSLWHGADLIGMGVASFSHFAGVHYQNFDSWEEYLTPLTRGELPIARALAVTPRQMLIRELILQLKTGHLKSGYFQGKFGVNIAQEFQEAFDSLVREGYASADDNGVHLTREGLLRVDALLPRFFEPEHRSVRYT